MQFHSPNLLWFLFLCLVPVIVHLFRFRRYRRVEFTRVDLLKQITVKTGLGNRLRKLLVMAMRIVAIAALVFAFASPYIPDKNAENQSPKNKLILFLDNSLSMSGEGQEGLIFEAAKNRARALANEFSNEYSFYLISHSQEQDYTKALDKAEVLEEIDKLPLVNSSLPQKEIFTLIQSMADKNSLFAYISDFRAGFLKNIPSDFDTSGLHYWLPVPANHTENISIDSVWFFSPQLLPEQTLTLNIKLTNHGTETVKDISLRLLEDEVAKGVVTVEVEAGRSKVVEIPFKAGGEGWKNTRLELPGDAFHYDDIFYLTYPVQKGSKGLVLSTDGQSPYFRALLTSGSGFEAAFSNPLQIVYDRLSELDFVIWDGLDEASSGLVDELIKFVESGGNLLVFPNKNPAQNAANLLMEKAGAGTYSLLNNQEVSADVWDLKDPLLSGIFQKTPENIDLPKVFSYYTLSSASRQVAFWKLKNGSPLAVRTKRGAGTIFSVAVPLDKEFSNLTMHPLFVPFVLRIASFKEADFQLAYETGTEEMLPLKGIKFNPNEVWTLQNDKNEWIPEIVLRDKQALMLTHGSIKEQGVYSLLDGTQSERYRFAFNLPRQESAGAVESKEDLQKKADELGVKLMPEKPDYLAAQIRKTGEGTSLWKYFILGALLFLTAEMILLRLWKV